MASQIEHQARVDEVRVTQDQEPMDGSAATETGGGLASPSREDASAAGPARTATSAVSVSSYTPQFAGVEALILDRIRTLEEVKPGAAPQSSSGPSNNEPNGSSDGGHAAVSGGGADEENEAREHSDPGRLGETLSMPTPSGQDTLTAAARIRAATSGHSLSRKRKRGDSQDQDAQEHQQSPEPVDFSQSTISLPPQILKPPPPPPVAPVVDEDADMRDAPAAAAAAAAVDEELERLRARKLAALPRGVVPAKPELVGFPAGPASDLALSTYFYSRKKTDLLNILSLCDQLKPQLLVDVLVSITKKHPDLPIFPSPTWNPDAQHPDARPGLKIRLKHSNTANSNTNNTTDTNAKPLFLNHHRRLPHQRPRHGHVIAPDSKARHKHKPPRAKIAKAPAAAEPDRDPDADEGDAAAAAAAEDNADSLPPTWPRADQGLYARLAAEDQDRAFLLDENDEEAFSHFAVDKYGKQTALLVLPAAA